MSLTIVNLARSHLGLPPLASTNRNSDFVLFEFNLKHSVNRVLRAFEWHEETITVCPSEVDVCAPCCDLPEPYCFAFAHPNDIVRITDVTRHRDSHKCCHPIHDDVQWTVRKLKQNGGTIQAILTDMCPVQLTYVCLPEDLDSLGNDLIDVIGLELAVRMAPQQKADKSLKRELRDELMERMKEAEMATSTQEEEEHFIEDGFLLRPRIPHCENVLRPGYRGGPHRFHAHNDEHDNEPRGGQAGKAPQIKSDSDTYKKLFGG